MTLLGFHQSGRARYHEAPMEIDSELASEAHWEAAQVSVSLVSSWGVFPFKQLVQLFQVFNLGTSSWGTQSANRLDLEASQIWISNDIKSLQINGFSLL